MKKRYCRRASSTFPSFSEIRDKYHCASSSSEEPNFFSMILLNIRRAFSYSPLPKASIPSESWMEGPAFADIARPFLLQEHPASKKKRNNKKLTINALKIRRLKIEWFLETPITGVFMAVGAACVRPQGIGEGRAGVSVLSGAGILIIAGVTVRA